MKEQEGRTHTHTHTCSLKFPKSISVAPHPEFLLHNSVPDSTAPFLLPGSQLGALPGLIRYSRGPVGWRGPKTGRWKPGFQGMQLISIKIPLLGAIRKELGRAEAQPSSSGTGGNAGIVRLADKDAGENHHFYLLHVDQARTSRCRRCE